MNLKKRAAFVGWFLLAAATASGCLTTYDTEAEKYVPSEPSNSCATGAVEVCDGVDNDCNDQVDEGCNDDADEHCDSAMVVNNDATNTPPAVCPAGGGDCDDTDRDVHPGTTDVCDDVDNDCNDNADEGCNPDGDEYCAIGSVVINQVSGAGPNVCPKGAGDCDESSADVFPGATELCDDLDNNCNEATDEGCDKDGDGVCDTTMTVVGTPATCVNGIDDCDDNNASVGGGSDEICDGLDNNCDLATDEGCDDDGDRYCDAAMTVDTGAGALTVCPLGEGDCLDEGDGADQVYPKNAEERCDNFDDDCNGTIDELCDLDDDDYCDGSLPMSAPLPAVCPLGSDDCDDTRAESYPGAEELCNDLLDTCGGVADVGCNDDGDTYCDESMTVVGNPLVCSGGGGDCDDLRNDVFPGAPDACGPVDFNCDNVRPALSFSDPVTVRGRSPSGDSEGMAFNGTDFAVTWVESTYTNNVARYALLNSSGYVSQGPFDLTTPNLAVDRTVIAYDATSQLFGVAYTVLDPVQRQFVLNLSTFDNLGNIQATKEIGAVQTNSHIRIAAAPGIFGLFYYKDVSGTTVMHYRPYTVATDTIGNEAALVGLPTSVGLYDVSIEHFPATSGAGTFFLGWQHFDSSFSPGEGFAVAGVRANNGSIYPNFKHVQFANSESGYWPSLAYLNGKMYVTYRGDANGATTSYFGDYYLRAQQLNTDGNVTGTAITLASNLVGSNARPIGTEGPNKTGNVGLVYMGYTGVASDTKATLARFDSNLAPIGVPQATWYGWFYNTLGGYGRELYYRSNKFSFFDTSSTSGFFTFLGIDYTNPSNMAWGSQREPITGATFSTELSTTQDLLSYDEVADNIRVLQHDPDDNTKLETYRIAKNGAVTGPVFFANVPTDCQSFQEEDGKIVCYGFLALFDQNDCYFPATGPASNEYDFVRNEWDGAAWQRTVLGVVPGVFFQDPWEPWITFCRAPYLLGQVGSGPDGLKTAFINRYVNTTFFPQTYIQNFTFSAGTATAQDVFKFDELSSSYLNVTLSEFSVEHHLFVESVVDYTADTQTLMVITVDTSTGLQVGTPVQLIQVPATDTSLRVLGLHFDGSAFEVLYSVDNTTTGVNTQYLQLFDPTTQSLLASPLVMTGFIESQHVGLAGTSDYRIVAENSRFDQQVWLYDEPVSPIDQVNLNYSLNNLYAESWLGYNGRDLRWLIKGPGFISYTIGQCANP